VSGRWSLREKKGKLKARQKSTDLDLLMAHAGAINEKFQDLVSFQERMSETGCSAFINVQADYVRSHVSVSVSVERERECVCVVCVCVFVCGCVCVCVHIYI